MDRTIVAPDLMLAEAARYVLIVALLVAGTGIVLRAMRWRMGTPAREPLPRLSGWLAVPRRYLVNVHEVVDREPSVSRMHIAAAGGFVACTLLSIVLFVAGVGGSAIAVAIVLASATTLIGASLVQLRRFPKRVARLSGGGYQLLAAALASYALFFGAAALSYAGVVAVTLSSLSGVLLLVAGTFGALVCVPGLVRGPMRHALAGLVHLAYPTRSARYEKDPVSASALRPVSLEAPKLGVSVPSDFAWNQLLSFDACVQCGRCESACPAYAAGAPLNPKKLIFDLWDSALGSGAPQAYSGHPHPGVEPMPRSVGMHKPIVGPSAALRADTLWACTTCRACVDECPMMIEHVDAVIDLRRSLTMERGETPGQGPALLDNMAMTDNVTGQAASARLAWAADLMLPLAKDKRRFDVLLWLGQGAYDPRNQRTLRALVKILRQARIDFAVLGSDERDCGDLARRLGDEATFQRLARANIELLARYSFQRIVTADPHALHVIKNEYPSFGGNYAVLHHTTLIAELIAAGRLPLEKSAVEASKAVTYHDPCYLGRYNGEFDSPRAVLRGLGLELREMTRSGRRSFCCGSGGGAAVTDIPGKKRISDIRIEQAAATGAQRLIVACPSCAIMFEGSAGKPVVVEDLAEVVAEALDAQPAGEGDRNDRAASTH